MTEQWYELKETIVELRDNDGTGTQQEVCKFLANLMDVLEKQMQESKTGHWIPVSERLPESSGVYIVSRWFTDGFDEMILTDACYFDGTSTWHNDNRINHSREYVDKKIVAWMPLPKPYSEVSE